MPASGSGRSLWSQRPSTPPTRTAPRSGRSGFGPPISSPDGSASSASSPTPTPLNPPGSRSTSAATIRLDLAERPGQSRFVSLAVDRAVRELAGFSARGAGKTTAALVAMILHAEHHRRDGGTLPTIWLACRDTFENHRLNLYKTLREPFWGGGWVLEDAGHVAVWQPGGVRMELMGVNDAAALNKLRTQCHGVWFEEAVPVLQNVGLGEDAWQIALSSQRLEPEAHHVALLTSNVGDTDHWARRRFIEDPVEGSRYVDLGQEGVSRAYLAELERSYQGRPDLVARLVEGRWAPVQLGAEVAQGFREAIHVRGEAMEPVAGIELWCGHDAGHMPSTVIAQRVQGQIVVYAGLVTMGTGMRQHLEQTLLPWLGAHAPWALEGSLLRHRYDPSMATGDHGDIRSSPLGQLRALVPGSAQPGPVSWPARWEPVRTVMNLYRDGQAVLSICPGRETRELRRALAGSWYFRTRPDGTVARELPHKPNPPYADLGDAFAYLLAGMQPTKGETPPGPPRPARLRFDPFDYVGRVARRLRPSRTEFDPWQT
jgi:hypothetical protein